MRARPRRLFILTVAITVENKPSTQKLVKTLGAAMKLGRGKK